MIFIASQSLIYGGFLENEYSKDIEIFLTLFFSLPNLLLDVFMVYSSATIAFKLAHIISKWCILFLTSLAMKHSYHELCYSLRLVWCMGDGGCNLSLWSSRHDTTTLIFSYLLCSSSAVKEEENGLLTDKDLKHLWQLVERKDGGPPWKHMMDRSTANMFYQAWQRDPEVLSFLSWQISRCSKFCSTFLSLNL